ncbi:MAG: anthranilate phosphoribosyltransferase family protein [Synechococcales cyanobacterium RM1_1_8]|nr:anthranilate phosphoribosyltransferase family protein [Synechococcales cyanobacterium RM1_1_8]
MSEAFRNLLKQVGSGTHTSEALTRDEAAQATELMLRQVATPAQIGAFMIAHRIRRPSAEEMAGLLDAYETLGPSLPPLASGQPVLVLGNPFDGRSRTAPVAPLIALLLSAAGCPVLMHGGRTMPTKYGVPLVDLWQSLGVDWTGLSLEALGQVFARAQVGLVYLPRHFPLAEGLTQYREELGKRPPLATLELVWNAYGGRSRLAVGYVHPPTEERLMGTLALRGCDDFIMVKGLEGSCDLPRDRTAIISVHRQGSATRLLLHPQDYGLGGKEVAYGTLADWAAQAQTCLAGESGELEPALLWSGGFYLWQMELAPSLEAGIDRAKTLVRSGAVQAQLESLIQIWADDQSCHPEAVTLNL